MLKADFTIAALIAKYLTGEITLQEQAEMDVWRNESEHHQELFERLIDPANMRELRHMAGQYDATQAWMLFQKKKHVKKQHFFLKAAGYAALLLLSLSIGYIYLSKDKTGQSTQKTSVIAELIVPGGTKATLTLADGSAVNLDRHSDYKLEEKQEHAQAPAYHKIETPKGGEYAFTLSDGTVVRLNAMSAIHFPIDFANGQRMIELTGEAFFEVKNTGQAFIIKTDGISIEVMGTSFNVSAYPDEVYCRTTLISGSVKVQVNNSGEHYLLTPSQQASFNSNTGDLSVVQVDASSYVAWKNGMFYFKDWRMEDIMHYLSRWYDIDKVVYTEDSIKDVVFGCKFSKYEDISKFLNLFERTGKISAQVHGKTIILNYTTNH